MSLQPVRTDWKLFLSDIMESILLKKYYVAECNPFKSDYSPDIIIIIINLILSPKIPDSSMDFTISSMENLTLEIYK